MGSAFWPRRAFPLCCMLGAVLLVAPCIHCLSPAIGKLLQAPVPTSINLSSTLAATQADFLVWLDKVRSKEHGNNPSVSATVFNTLAAVSTSSNTLTVAKSGSADFTTVQAAVNSVPSGNSQRVVIQIAAGTYKEKVNVPSNKPYISFIGAGSVSTTITWDDTASSAGSTFKSGSVIVSSDYFIARDISFQNSALAPPPGAVGRQAVALRISGDKAAFYSCSFYGAQDTLYDDTGRHYFKSCFIQGSIDFIFGDGQSFYDGCELHSIATSSGSLTAQNRQSPSEDTGFSFVNCKVSGSGMVYLGRAWGAYSRVVFLFTYMDNIIVPAGWNNFGDPSREKTAFYGEYQCSGPGASSKSRVAWSYQLSVTQATPFETLSFIDGESWVQT